MNTSLAADRLTSRHHNNFNLLRLAAAVCVIITHSYALLGLPERDLLNRLTHGLVSFSQLGLYSFFVISGFLIYASLQRSSTYSSFFFKRIRRIFPALAIVILSTVFILGPLTTTLSLRSYFSQNETYRYLGGLTLYRITYTLPGVFMHNPYPRAINGSLWTLPYEWTWYIILAAVFWIIKQKPRAILCVAPLITLGIRTLVGRYHIASVIPFLHLDVRQLMLFGTFFLLGALGYEMRTAIPYKGKVVGVLLLTTWLTSTTALGLYVLIITLPYLILMCAAYELPQTIQRLFSRADYSYGLYIYAFPVGQLLVAFVPTARHSVASLALTTMIATIPCAIFSWHIIEKKMLRFSLVKKVTTSQLPS